VYSLSLGRQGGVFLYFVGKQRGSKQATIIKTMGKSNAGTLYLDAYFMSGSFSC